MSQSITVIFLLLSILILGFKALHVPEPVYEIVLICPHPALNSDSGIEPNDLDGYLSMCNWKRVILDPTAYNIPYIGEQE